MDRFGRNIVIFVILGFFRSGLGVGAPVLCSITWGLTGGTLCADVSAPVISAVAMPGAPLKPFVDASGVDIEVTKELSPDATIGIVNVSSSDWDWTADHAAMESILKKGGSVILSLRATSNKQIYALEDLAPVNFWSLESSALQRLSSGILAPRGSPFAQVLQTPGARLPMRYDLHLPYSPWETGQHRYEWERMGKSLLNTDWQTLLVSDQDGHLPLLVEGRCYAGHVFIFAGDLAGTDFASWSGYPSFVHTLLSLARPTPVASGPAVDGLKISVPSYQPGSGDLQVLVANPGASAVQAVFSAKVRTLVRGLMNSFSEEINVPAGQTLTVKFPEGAPAREAGVAVPSGDTALPFRRLEVGLCALDRQRIAVEADAVVDRTPATQLALQGEDVQQFPAVDSWPMGGIDMTNGKGFHLARYTYFCGEQPHVTVRLSQGLHNIAPLATASDLNWPENITVQGLNDGAISYDSVRTKFPLCGYWSGHPAEAQHLQLTWPMPVMVAGQQLFAQTDYRHWDATNPRNYKLTGQNGDKTLDLAAVTDAAYQDGVRGDSFPPQTLTRCELAITGLGTTPRGEPSAIGCAMANVDPKINCSIGEWEVDGWPSATPPPAAKGHLAIVCHDLSTGKTTPLLDKDVDVPALAQSDFPVVVPTRDGLGQVTIEARFTPAEGGEPEVATLPFLFVPRDKPHLLAKSVLCDADIGLLCTPGFCAIDDFGKGTSDDTGGWGGPDDKAWAWSLDMMEISDDPRCRYYPQHFLLSPVGMTHYSNPYHDFPSGEYGWDWATPHLVDIVTTGRFKGKKTFHITLADRWNGVPIGSTFAWTDIVRFDEYLRGQGKPGLQGKTRTELWKEIASQHANEYQHFILGRYADAMLGTQAAMAKVGVSFMNETHGSFPLAGGEMGRKLAAVDTAVGTDLFWELRDEDVFKGIGYRVGLVSANPNLKSGAYDQWEWISGTQQNATWFAPSGDAEPSRSQWYNTYWKGRVDSDGVYQPYTMYGFSLQGGMGVKCTMSDWTQFNRVQSTMIWVRPDQPAGVGIVSSWQLQENHMAPNSRRFGFGLYASDGYHPDDPHNTDGAHPQIDAELGEVYHRLVKNGVPLSFIANTDTLKKWNSTRPLVAVDGFEVDPWEIAEFDRLNRAGTPIIAIGSDGSFGRTEAEKFFGVKRTRDGWVPAEGTTVINDEAGQPLAYCREGNGRGPALLCPLAVKSIDGPQSAILAQQVQKLSGQPFELPYGVTSAPFVSQGCLFVAFTNMADGSRLLDIAVRPGAVAAAFTGRSFRVVDHDRGVVLPSEWKDGALHFQLPAAACDGRLIQIIPASS